MNDKTTLLITLVPYVFNLSTDSQYNDTKFKGLLIDSRVSTWSTEGISQLKVLEQLDNSIQLNKSIAGYAHFIFKIGSITSI